MTSNIKTVLAVFAVTLFANLFLAVIVLLGKWIVWPGC